VVAVDDDGGLAREERGSPVRRILVGYDGSEQAARALDFAIETIAQNDEAEIHLAYVVQKPGGVPDPVPDEVLDVLQKTGEETLLNAERRVRKNLSRPITHLETGNAAQKLLELADRLKPELVVLGTLRHSTSEKLLGTVSSSFLKSRRHPLLIVP
jgi:nucleotide-binding universal stress UspA family protein